METFDENYGYDPLQFHTVHSIRDEMHVKGELTQWKLYYVLRENGYTKDDRRMSVRHGKYAL